MIIFRGTFAFLREEDDEPVLSTGELECELDDDEAVGPTSVTSGEAVVAVPLAFGTLGVQRKEVLSETWTNSGPLSLSSLCPGGLRAVSGGPCLSDSMLFTALSFSSFLRHSRIELSATLYSRPAARFPFPLANSMISSFSSTEYCFRVLDGAADVLSSEFFRFLDFLAFLVAPPAILSLT